MITLMISELVGIIAFALFMCLLTGYVCWERGHDKGYNRGYRSGYKKAKRHFKEAQ